MMGARSFFIDFSVGTEHQLGLFLSDDVLWWYGIGEKNSSRDNAIVADDSVAAEDDCVGVDGDPIADGGMAFTPSDESSTDLFRGSLIIQPKSPRQIPLYMCTLRHTGPVPVSSDFNPSERPYI